MLGLKSSPSVPALRRLVLLSAGLDYHFCRFLAGIVPPPENRMTVACSWCTQLCEKEKAKEKAQFATSAADSHPLRPDLGPGICAAASCVSRF
jgi:hypothetical protein